VTARNLRRIIALTVLTMLAGAASASALPIPPAGVSTLPDFEGSAAKAQKIKNAPKPEQNPHMAANPNSNIHNDTWMTDAYHRRGPLGENLTTTSYAYQSSLCGSIAFDSQGRIVTICPSIPFAPQVRLIDPETLAPIDTYDMPQAPNPPGQAQYQNFAGGGYFFLDQKDRIWASTKTNHIYRMSLGADGDTITLERDYDLTGVLDSETERITSALPDYDGLLWFVSKANGKVGTLDTKSGEIEMIRLGEDVQNSFAVGADGVYIVSSKRMYRFKANKKNKPRIVWSKKYPNSGIKKPSQADAGSGTTPTIMHGGFVAITDNADPMNVVVYRTAKKLKKGEKREVCRVPVFEPGASATENSLMGAGRSLIVENNYGYQDPFGPTAGALTEPGFARIDLKKNGKGCKKVWTNTEVRAPTVVPKLSVKTGLIYTYARPEDPSGNEGYFWTAIDYRTGETVWQKYSGSGLTFNNNYAGIALGPNGDAYLGVIGGLIKLSDG
jgi:streptogramin lyase